MHACAQAGKQQAHLQTFSLANAASWRTGIPSSSVIIRDIRVSEVSYSTSSATYALEVDAMVLFTSSSTQMQFYQLALSGTLSMPVRSLISFSSVFEQFSPHLLAIL